MIDSRQLDELAQRLADTVPSGLRVLQDDLRKNLRAALESGLSRLDLVTREEFDVQRAVLARTREKLEALEKQLEALEQQTGGPPADD
jgi:BMFP domain-containing protein YqiC